MSRKELNLGHDHKIKLETYAESNNLSHSEAARRLIDHGLKHEQQPGIAEDLINKSIMQTAFMTLFLAVFTMLHPVFALFAVVSFGFLLVLLGAKYIRWARRQKRGQSEAVHMEDVDESV